LEYEGQKNMKKIIYTSIVILLLAQVALAADQDTLRPRYGIFAGYNFNFHSAGFSNLPGVSNCCPQFESGSGNGMAFGVLFESPINDEFLIGFKAGYFDRSGLLEKEQPTVVSVDQQDVDGFFTHTIDASISTLTFEPLVSYRVKNGFFVHAGASAGIFMGATYDQKEEITQPSDRGVFKENGLRTRNESSGDLPEASAFQMGLTAGMSYEFPLNPERTIMLAPELFYTFGITDQVQERDWKVSSLRAGVAVKYTPFETKHYYERILNIDTVDKVTPEVKEEIVKLGVPQFDKITDEKNYEVYTTETITRTDTLMIPAPIAASEEKMPDIVEGKEIDLTQEKDPKDIGRDVIAADTAKKIIEEKDTLKLEFNMYAVDDKGKNELSRLGMKVELRKDVYPLLPYVFFEHNSSDIPERYKQVKDLSKFDATDLYPSPLVYHRYILNIIGDRLQKNANANLVINGYADPETENADCQLALERANAVREYFINTFDLDESRVSVVTKETDCSPGKTTRTKSAEGYAENRRVEMSSNDPSILSPVRAERYQSPIGLSPEMIEFDFEGSSLDVVKSWSMTAEQGRTEKLIEDGDKLPQNVEHKLLDEEVYRLNEGSPLSFVLTAQDADGNSKSVSKQITVASDSSDIEIESLTLTLFDVSQTALDDRLKGEIKNFFVGLDKNSKVYIKGYTDVLGDEEHNLRLSQARADKVKAFIKRIAPTVRVESSVGVGSGEYPPGISSYQTAEERFMSRTVKIEIRKKLEK
jgi:outer membrane protein OmpA-like peptidoglycan-associated protein